MESCFKKIQKILLIFETNMTVVRYVTGSVSMEYPISLWVYAWVPPRRPCEGVTGSNPPPTFPLGHLHHHLPAGAQAFTWENLSNSLQALNLTLKQVRKKKYIALSNLPVMKMGRLPFWLSGKQSPPQTLPECLWHKGNPWTLKEKEMNKTFPTLGPVLFFWSMRYWANASGSCGPHLESLTGQYCLLGRGQSFHGCGLVFI